LQQVVTIIDPINNMQLISAYLSDNTTVSLVSEVADEDPESHQHHLMVDGRIECSYNSWEHAWEEFGLCVRCATVTEVVKVARDCTNLYSTSTENTNEDQTNERGSNQECTSG
jgi:hypothetical protein